MVLRDDVVTFGLPFLAKKHLPLAIVKNIVALQDLFKDPLADTNQATLKRMDEGLTPMFHLLVRMSKHGKQILA
jgi:hypothetical protein